MFTMMEGCLLGHLLVSTVGLRLFWWLCILLCLELYKRQVVQVNVHRLLSFIFRRAPSTFSLAFSLSVLLLKLIKNNWVRSHSLTYIVQVLKYACSECILYYALEMFFCGLLFVEVVQVV